MSKQLTDDELSAFIPEHLRSEWQASRTHPHCKWDADAVVGFLRELALARAFLADTPACDAEKAVLVAALRSMTHYLRGLVIWNHGDDEKKWPGDKSSVVLVREADAALADRSPAAAALLAQGERLERVKEWQEEWDGVGTVDWAALSAILEEPARAALAPGEGTDG